MAQPFRRRGGRERRAPGGRRQSSLRDPRDEPVVLIADSLELEGLLELAGAIRQDAHSDSRAVSRSRDVEDGCPEPLALRSEPGIALQIEPRDLRICNAWSTALRLGLGIQRSRERDAQAALALDSVAEKQEGSRRVALQILEIAEDDGIRSRRARRGTGRATEHDHSEDRRKAIRLHAVVYHRTPRDRVATADNPIRAGVRAARGSPSSAAASRSAPGRNAGRR